MALLLHPQAVGFKGIVQGGGAICLENTFKNSTTNVLGFCALCQTKDQSLPVLMGHKKNFIFFFKFNKLQII